MASLLPALLASVALFGAAHAACREIASAGARYAVCEFDPQTDDIRLFLDDSGGAPYREFEALESALAERGETLLFAMNAGMYHADGTPVGLYVEGGRAVAPLNVNDGPGNFHLKPNGVFWIGDGGAHVAAADIFAQAAAKRFPPPLAGEVSPKATEGGLSASAAPTDGDRPPQSAASRPTVPPQAGEQGSVRYATQSGPMLVIDGKIHPRFLVEASSKKRRNGVGVRDDGAVVFALADSSVTFHQFATFFRDELKTPNALYLDGGTGTSRLYAPDLSRADPGDPMGPIVGVVASSAQGHAQ